MTTGGDQLAAVLDEIAEMERREGSFHVARHDTSRALAAAIAYRDALKVASGPGRQ